MRPGEIKIDGLGKRYWFQSGFDEDNEAEEAEDDIEDQDEGASSRLMSLFRGQRSEFWALRDISCHIRPGERVAIVGANGSGKSTLLQILSRVLPPSEGSITGGGMVVPFDALRKPISPQASGVENLRMLARLLGIPLEHLEERLPEIVAFSELGRLANERVSRYSDRSYARLSMAMGLLVDADVYLVDDDLKVGDDVFRNKFEEKLAEVLRRNVTVVYASNNLGALRVYCRRAIWLSQGRLVADGEVSAVVQRFLATSDDAIDFSELAAPENARSVDTDSAWPPALAPVTVDESRLEPAHEWLAACGQAEQAWQKVLGKWRKKIRPSDLGNTGSIVAESSALGVVHTLRCLNSEGRPFSRCLPGEPVFVELLVETLVPGVKVGVRLEFDASPVLIFVSEPIIPLLASQPGAFLFRVEIPASFMEHAPDSVLLKVRTRVLFRAPGDEMSEMSNATVRFDLRGDIRVSFDEQRKANGEPATSVAEPTPAYIGRDDEIEGSDRGSSAHPPLTRWDYLSRRPLLRPRLDWMIYEVVPEADAGSAAGARQLLLDSATG